MPSNYFHFCCSIILGAILFIRSAYSLNGSYCKEVFTDPHDIHIALLLPEENFYLPSRQRVEPAIKLGIKKINKWGLLPGLKFEVIRKNTKCDTSFGIWKAMGSYMDKRIRLFLGPSCDYVAAPVARLLKFMNIPMITAGALAYDFNAENRRGNESEYYMLVRTGWTFKGMAMTMYLLFEKFNWYNLAFLYEADGRPEVMKDHYCHLAMQSIFELTFQNKNCTVAKQKLKPNLTAEEAQEVVLSFIGNEHGGK